MKRLVLLLGLFAGTVWGQDSLNIRSVGQLFDYWYTASDFCVSGRYAYVAAEDAGLFVVDLIDEFNPVVAGHYDTRQARSVYAEGNFVYVGDAVELLVFDVSTPSNPQIIGRTSSHNAYKQIAKAGNYLFVAGEYSGFSVFNIATPQQPAFVYHWPPSDTIRTNVSCLAVQGDFLFVGEAGGSEPQIPQGVRVFNIANPAEPLEMVLQVDCAPQAMQVRDSLLLIADYNPWADTFGRLTILNVRNPAAPSPMSTTNLPGMQAYHLALLGNRAYVSTSYMRAVDFSNPAAPVVESQTSQYIGALYATGNRLYGLQQGLTVWNVEDPSMPYLMGGLYNQAALYGVAVQDSLAFVTDAVRGLHVVNVADPAHPQETGQCELLVPGRSVAVYGHYVYQPQGSSMSNTLYVVNVANPRAPEQAGEWQTTGDEYFGDIKVNGQHLYLCGDSAVYVLSLANPVAPQTVAQIQGLISPASMCIPDTRLFVADHSGLHIYNIADPANPFELGVYSVVPGDYGLEAAVIGDRAFFEYWAQSGPNTWQGRMAVLDVSDPSDPHTTGTTSPFVGFYLTASGSHLIGSTSSAIKILDTRYADSLRVTGSYQTQSHSNGFAVRDGIIYLADMCYFDILDANTALPASDAPAAFLPERIALGDAYPNPFNPATTLTFTLPRDARVSLKIFDVTGREVALLTDQHYAAGTYRMTFDGSRFASGIYFARLDAGGIFSTKKLMLLK